MSVIVIGCCAGREGRKEERKEDRDRGKRYASGEIEGGNKEEGYYHEGWREEGREGEREGGREGGKEGGSDKERDREDITAIRQPTKNLSL